MSEPRAFRKLTLPASEAYKVPREMVLVAERRTEHLLAIAFRTTLWRLLANAYMQGMNDALDAQASDGGSRGA